MSRILVTGSGGFIAHHLIRRLKAEGHFVRGVDIVMPAYERSAADEFIVADLRNADIAYRACAHIDTVYHLACDMGGIQYTLPHSFDQRVNNTRIDLNVADAAREQRVKTIFFASSACVYNETLQDDLDASALKEEDAYPAQPDLSYGWVKLACEQLLDDLTYDTPINVRIARFHNVYGTMTDWDTNRAKAPAALCRKIALAKLRGDDSITVFGDGKQRRSFMYIDDCIEGIQRLVASDYREPINLGRDEAVSINELALLICDEADYHVYLNHDLSAPQGVRARNSNNARLREVLGWQPSISLQNGISELYGWVEQQVIAKYGEKSNV